MTTKKAVRKPGTKLVIEDGRVKLQVTLHDGHSGVFSYSATEAAQFATIFWKAANMLKTMTEAPPKARKA